MPTNRKLKLKGSAQHNAQRRLFSTLHHIERSNDDIQFVINFLSSELLFFQELPETTRRAIASHAIVQHARPGQTIINNEDSALALYLVWSGSGTVFRRGIENPDDHITDTSIELDRRQRRMYGNENSNVVKGDVFGEEGLLQRLKSYETKGDLDGHELVPSGAAKITVVAHPTHGMVCFVIDFLLFVKYLWPHRNTLCWAPSHCMEILALEPKDRTTGNLELVRRFVARIPFFQQLSRNHQIDLCRVMKEERHESSQSHRVIFQEGWPGDKFYVIVSGVVSVHQRLVQTETNNEEDQKEDQEQKKSQETNVAQRFHHEKTSKYGPAVAELRHGDSFGASALNGNAMRNATIICQSQVVLLMVVDRESVGLQNLFLEPKLLLNTY